MLRMSLVRVCGVPRSHLRRKCNPLPTISARAPPGLNNATNQLILVSQTHPRARDSCLPLGWDVTDG